MTFTFPKINLPSKITIKKPDINLGLLQKSIGYITASISLVPPLRPVVLGITTVADLASKGKSSEYLNNGQKSNSTLNFVPGGDLVQKILNDSTKGKSGDFITTFTPDIKEMAINEVGKKNLLTNYGPFGGKPVTKKPLLFTKNSINEQNTIFPINDINNNYLYDNKTIVGKKQISYKKKLLNNIADKVIIKENSSTFSNNDTTQMNFLKKENILPVITRDNIVVKKNPVKHIITEDVNVIDNKLIEKKSIDMSIPFISSIGLILLLFLRS